MQDYTGKIYTPAEPADSPVDIALRLADERGKAPTWQTAFELARKLTGRGQAGELDHEGAVKAFCRRAGIPFEEFWYAFLDSWHEVKFAVDEDVFGWAARRA